MKRMSFYPFWIFLFSFFLFAGFASILLFFTCSIANAFQAEISPHEISPGDAFIIKVIAKTSQLPVASLAEKQFYFSNCGEDCFIAIGSAGLDTKPGDYLIHISVGNEKRSLDFTVKQRIFPIQRITLPYDMVFLSRDNLKRVGKENEKITSLCQVVSDRLWAGRFIQPLKNDVSTIFGVKRILNNKKISIHRGVDIKGEEGEEVKASNNGRVVLTEELFFGGNTVILDHGHGIYTLYMHLSRFNVKSHDIVSKGDIIGFVGSTGRSSSAHLHFGVKVLNINTNPLSLLRLDL